MAFEWRARHDGPLAGYSVGCLARGGGNAAPAPPFVQFGAVDN